MDVTKPPESVGQAAIGAAQAEAQRTKSLVGPTGLNLYNPNTPTPMGEAANAAEAAPAARVAESAGGDIAQAAVRAAGQAGGEATSALDNLAQAAGKAVDNGASEAAPHLSPETLAKVPEELQPHIDAAAASLGMDDETAAKALDVASDPSQLDRIQRTKNPGRDLTPVQQDARNLLKQANKSFLAQAATDDSVPIEQSVQQAAQLANPDQILEQQLRASIEQAGGKVPEPRQPVWAGVTEPPAATAPAAGPIETPPALPSGRQPGPAAPRMVQLANGEWRMADRTPLWLVDKADTATSDALVRDAARESFGPWETLSDDEKTRLIRQRVDDDLRDIRPFEVAGLKPREVGPNAGGIGNAPPPSGIDYGIRPGGQPPTPGQRAQTIGRSLARPVLQQGAFAAGAAYGWNEDTSDDLTHRIGNALLRGAEASTLAYGVAGGAPKGIPGRLLDAFIGNLISPKTAGLKFSHDVAETLVGGPSIHFLSGLLDAAHGEGAGAVADAARESGSMWASLVGSSAGWREGMRAAVDILTGAAPMSHDLTAIVKPTMSRGEGLLQTIASPGKSATELGPRAISAVTALFQHAMYAQEMAVETLRAGHNANAYEGMAERAMARVQQRLMMGSPTGGLGSGLLGVQQALQHAPLFGGRLVTPFARIPANYLDRTASGIPILGLANLVGAKTPKDVLARQAFGLLAGAGTLGLWQLFGDRIQGAGPPDPTINKSLRDNEGFLPFSVRDPQSGFQVEMRKLPSYAKGPLMLLGTINDVQRYGASPEVVANAAKQASRALGTADAVTNLFNWIENGMTASQLASQVSGIGPWYARQPEQASRPYAVDTKGTALLPPGATMGDKLKAGAATGLQEAGVPGTGQPSGRLQPASGEPAPNEAQGVGALVNPFGTGTLRSNAVADALGKVGLAVPEPPPSVTVKGVQVQLSGEQQRQYEQARGQWLTSHLPEGGFSNPEVAKKYLDDADKVATAAVLPDVKLGDQAQPAKAADREKKAGAGAFWKAATTGQPSAAPSGTPTPPPAAPASSGGAFWKRTAA